MLFIFITSTLIMILIKREVSCRLMKRKVIQTADGSSTVYIDEMDVTYHSRHGALQESDHVFISAGLKFFLTKNKDVERVCVFEMGLGTGLNALLTWRVAKENDLRVYYESVEQYPLTTDEASALSFYEGMLSQIHSADWDIPVELERCFSIKKCNATLTDHNTENKFHIIYYDAFAPAAQPELWTEKTFQKMYNLLEKGGVMVTYCSKGDVRRAMLAAGFEVKKIPGPPGKREMLRASKKRYE